MSWDRYEFDEISKCACGNGLVIKHCWREDDDWNRSRDGVSGYDIECFECRKKYHVQSIKRYYSCYSWEGDGICTTEYLTPKELNMPDPMYKSHIQTKNIDEEIASLFTIDELKSIIVDMTQSKYSTRVKLDKSKRVIRAFNKRRHIKALSKIIPVLHEIVQKYDSYKWHPDTVAEFYRKEDYKIKENRKAIKDIIAKSFELQFTRGEQS